jgi:hypothetical protein
MLMMNRWLLIAVLGACLGGCAGSGLRQVIGDEWSQAGNDVDRLTGYVGREIGEDLDSIGPWLDGALTDAADEIDTETDRIGRFFVGRSH